MSKGTMAEKVDWMALALRIVDHISDVRCKDGNAEATQTC